MLKKSIAVFKVWWMWVLILACSPALADSAAAWKDYQSTRNPLMELGYLVVGMIIFFTILSMINKAVERKKKKR